MSGTMKVTLIVRDPESSAPVALVEGSELPDWAENLVDPADVEGGSRRAKHESFTAGPPPLHGAGSGIDEWRAYADGLDVPLDPDAKRGDIVDAIRDAGHPVE